MVAKSRKSKVYDVLVDGKSVFSGSYRSALVVYDSILSSFDLLDLSPVVVLAFKPDIKSNSDGGLFV